MLIIENDGKIQIGSDIIASIIQKQKVVVLEWRRRCLRSLNQTLESYDNESKNGLNGF